MEYLKNYGGYLVAGFTGWECAHSDWTIAIIAGIVTVGLVMWSKN